MSDAEINLLTCPFCGSEASVWCHEYGDCHPERYYSVCCDNEEDCGLGTGEFTTPAPAIALWNRPYGTRIFRPMKKVNW